MKKHRTGIADAMPDRYMKHVGVILTALLGCCLLAVVSGFLSLSQSRGNPELSA